MRLPRWMWTLALTSLVGVAATPATVHAAGGSGCGGVALSLAAAAIVPGQAVTLAVTAEGVPSPGVAGFDFTVSYDPTVVTVASVQGGPDFPQVQANLQTAAQGTVAVAGASAAGATGDPVLALLTVRASATALPGSTAGLQLQDVSLVDTGPTAMTACPTAEGSLTVTSGPKVTGISPLAGVAAGGTAVTITGTGFTGATVVRFGGTSAAGFTVVGDDQITATAPPGSGTVDVTVTTPLGTSPIGSTDRFTYASGPTLVLTAAADSAPTGEAVAVTALVVGAAALPEPSQTLAFTTTGSAALSAAQAVTDASGQATVYVTDTGPEAVTVGASAPGGTTGTVQVVFTRLPAIAGTATLPGSGISIAPTTPLPLTGALQGTDQIEFIPAGVPAGSIPLRLALTVPAAQAAAVLGSVTATVDAAPDETALLQQSDGIQLEVGAPSAAGQMTFAGPVLDFQTTGAAAQLFGDDTSQTTDPAIELTLPYDPTALPRGASPMVMWLDTTQSPPVWTDQGVTIVASTTDTVTALLPHLSQYTVVGVSLRTATWVTLNAAPQTGAPGSPITLTATVDDQNGQPLSGVTVAFTTTVGQLAAQTATTNADGQAATQLTSEAAASGTITASVTGVSEKATVAVTFTTTAAAGGQSRPTPTFTDVPPTYWAASAITQLASAGIVGGFPDGTFQPDTPVTRAQFVKMLVLTLGLTPAAHPAPFTDVPTSAWYAPYLATAVQAGLVEGLTPTTFAPDATLTREQMALLLARALKLTQTVPLHFTDTAEIDPWALPGVEAAVAAGDLDGFPDGTFQPLATATRAQAAKVLAAVLDAQGR